MSNVIRQIRRPLFIFTFNILKKSVVVRLESKWNQYAYLKEIFINSIYQSEEQQIRLINAIVLN